MTFTFWEVPDGSFILTPPAMWKDVPSKYPGANAIWEVEASNIRDAQSEMIGHMGWGPVTWFDEPPGPDPI